MVKLTVLLAALTLSSTHALEEKSAKCSNELQKIAHQPKKLYGNTLEEASKDIGNCRYNWFIDGCFAEEQTPCFTFAADYMVQVTMLDANSDIICTSTGDYSNPERFYNSAVVRAMGLNEGTIIRDGEKFYYAKTLHGEQGQVVTVLISNRLKYDAPEAARATSVTSTNSGSRLIPNSYYAVFKKGTVNTEAEAFSLLHKVHSISAREKSGARFLSFRDKLSVMFINCDAENARKLNETGLFETAAQQFRVKHHRASSKREEKKRAISPAFLKLATETEQNATWGLARISTVRLPRSYVGATYTYPVQAGAGVTVYVLDSGIDIENPEFGGRATWGFTATGLVPDVDEDGHGTEMAGVIGSQTYGVAKQVNLVAVKVLNSDGFGSTESLLEGMVYISEQKIANPDAPTLINMSLGYDARIVPIIDLALEILTSMGIGIAVSAGNENYDACLTTPARAPSVLTVAATNEYDVRYIASNWGPCVDLYAPGVHIETTSLYNETDNITGTSPAAAFVTGTMALYLGQNPSLTVPELNRRVVNDAITVRIRYNEPDTTCKLVNIKKLNAS